MFSSLADAGSFGDEVRSPPCLLTLRVTLIREFWWFDGISTIVGLLATIPPRGMPFRETATANSSSPPAGVDRKRWK